MATPEVSYTLEQVTVGQGNSLDPYLRVYLTVKLDNNTNNVGVNAVELFSIRGTLFVNTSSSDNGWREIGFAETPPTYSSVYSGNETRFDLVAWLSPHLLNKIESMRSGRDLYFKFAGGWLYTQANVVRGTARSNEVIVLKSYSPIYKYPRSEWIDHLNTTEFTKLDLIELPKLVLPSELPITSDITKFLHDAEQAMKEGRWGDVFGESRKALNTLYNGIEEWGSKQQLTKEENDNIENAKPDEKLNIRRNIYFSRLVGQPEKGRRLNAVRNSLYQYLSLYTHEPDHKGIDFTQSDAIFVSRAAVSFIANVLSHLQYQVKDRQ